MPMEVRSAAPVFAATLAAGALRIIARCERASADLPGELQAIIDGTNLTVAPAKIARAIAEAMATAHRAWVSVEVLDGIHGVTVEACPVPRDLARKQVVVG